MNNDFLKNIRIYVYSDDDVVQTIMKAYNYPLFEAVKILTKGNYIFYPSTKNDYELGKNILFNAETIIDTIKPNNLYNYIDKEKVYKNWEDDLKQDWLENYPDTIEFDDNELYQNYVHKFLEDGIKQALCDVNYEFIEEYFDYEKYGSEQYFRYIDDNAILVY